MLTPSLPRFTSLGLNSLSLEELQATRELIDVLIAEKISQHPIGSWYTPLLPQQIPSDYAIERFRAFYANYLLTNSPPVNYWVSSLIPYTLYPAYFSDLRNTASTTFFYKIKEAIKRVSKTKALIYSQNSSNAIYPNFIAGSYSRQTYLKNSSETEQLSKYLSEKTEPLETPKTPRTLGIWKNKVKIAEDFDDCLNEINNDL